jgi:hypothetical protein
MPTPVWLQLLGVSVGVLSGGIVIYRFIIKRPNLILQIGIAEEEEREDAVIVSISFHIANAGRDFAEDCYVRVGTYGWGTGWRGDSKFDVSILDVDKKDKTIMGSTEIHQLFIDNVLYPGTKFQIFAERARLERNEEYELEYIVACRSYKSTKGKITIRVDDGSIRSESIHPTFWNRFQKRVVNLIPSYG